ncbi:type VII secretion protein EccB [Corynebacterium lipophiloflavum DSM 44291]|uniref:Type VII secretion protein EccB n=2 Tax=Corynebacterium lipophiloflavum TaxID=161889 RepID=C0XUR8_CORLD|nr:type VII secretion protein EccB [Corynebacterium lipophiloflavum DSM 44291]
MRRRVEHGLIFGDIRMIHDPLASRQRAMIFSIVAVLLIAAITALFAWLRPNADPGDAPILRSGSGELYVRINDTIHPVTNLTSARLIVGAPEEPQRIGDENLLAQPRGVPVGIAMAPSLFAPRDSEDLSWSACTFGSEVVVIAGPGANQLAGASAVLAEVGGQQWLVTGGGRRLLPPADAPTGRVIRRALGVDANTPRWSPPSQLLNALKEEVPLEVPNPLPEIVVNGSDSWAVAADGGVQPLSRLQSDILTEAGAPQRIIGSAELAQLPDAEPPIDIRLPAEEPVWLDPVVEPVCATEAQVGATFSEPLTSSIALSGGAVAVAFAGLDDGAVAVDSGHGYHVVSLNGMRHDVPDPDVLDMIGAEHVEQVPWEIIALLPQADTLTQDGALISTY